MEGDASRTHDAFAGGSPRRRPQRRRNRNGGRGGGLIVDLSLTKSIHVDPERRTVRADGGAAIGELDAKTQIFNLAAPMGVVSKTDVAGLTLSGGIGWLRRKHGLSSDNLAPVDIAAADGRFLSASETRNAGLFRGVRGGGRL